MATNQEKLDKIYDTILVLQKIVENGSIDALNYKVKDVAGKEQSVFDLVRSVGGTQYDVPWYGFDGKVPAGGRNTTRLSTDVGWNDTRIAELNKKLDALTAAVAKLTKEN